MAKLGPRQAGLLLGRIGRLVKKQPFEIGLGTVAGGLAVVSGVKHGARKWKEGQGMATGRRVGRTLAAGATGAAAGAAGGAAGTLASRALFRKFPLRKA